MIPNSSTIPEPLHIVTERPLQWPTSTGTNAPGSIPVHALPVLVKNNVQLANKPASPPPHPTIAQTLTSLPLSLQFSFNQVTLPIGATNVMSSYRVYRNTTANNFSGATLMRTFVHDPTRQGAITVQDNTGAGKSYYYFVTSVDTTSQESAPVGAQAGAITSSNANPNVSESVGTTSAPSTTSTTYVVIPEMTVTLTTKGNRVLLAFTMSFVYSNPSVTGNFLNFAVFKDGSQISSDYACSKADSSGVVVFQDMIAITLIDAPTAASHTYDIRWKTSSATYGIQANTTARRLQVIELG